jgi:methyl-accepting chemotaxis protein
MLKIFRVVDWPIALKLITVMVLITLVPLGAVGHLNGQYTTDTWKPQIGETFTQLAASNADEVRSYLTENVNLLMALSIDDDIVEILNKRNEYYQGTEQEILDQILDLDEQWSTAYDFSSMVRNVMSDHPDVNPIGSELHGFKNAFPDHVEVFVTDKYGANVAATGRTTDYYQADEGWWQAAYNGGEGAIYIGNPEYDESAGVTAVIIALPIMDDDDEIMGVIRTTLDFTAITNIITRFAVGQTGYAKLVDRNGIVLADPDPEKTGVALDEGLVPAEDLRTGSTSWFEGVENDGTEILLGLGQVGDIRSIDAIKDLGWTTVVLMESSEALAPVNATTAVAVGSAIVAAVAAAVVAIIITRGLTLQIRDIMDLFSYIGVGDFDARVRVRSNDEMGKLAVSLNAMLDNTLALIQTREERDTMQTSVRKLLEEVSGVADGDLTAEAEVTADMTGAIADAFNHMITQLRNIISNVQDATLQVSSSANKIRVSTEELSEGSETQADRLAQTSEAVDEMASSIQQVSQNAASSAEVGNQALASAQQGVLAVQNTIEGMTRIRDQVQETSKRIKRLGEGSQEIGEIVQLISDIADRTSILALNASIQAASAGEAGQGFAVVAEEVERLAEQSNEATKQIETLIRTIQNETNEAVAAMESTTKEVVEGSMLAEEAGHALNEIGNVSNRLTELIQSISMASQEQARSSEGIAKSVSEIASVTKRTAEGTKQAAVSISNLATLADGLRSSVSAFKLPDGDGKVPEAEATAAVTDH